MSVWLVVGLGNPGPAYAATRHNVGHLVVGELADRVAGSSTPTWRRHRTGRADVVEGRLGPPGSADAPALLLARLRSYMNESGGPVAAVAAYARVPAERLIVVHDELDLPFGTVRVKRGGGDNGHNGLRSVRRSLDTGDFTRVRMGVGRPTGHQEPADFVLSPYSAVERREVTFQVDRAADIVESVVLAGLATTQNMFNG